MFGTQIDDPVTMTTPPKADPVVTGVNIRGSQIDPIRPPVDFSDDLGLFTIKSVDSCF